MKKGFYKRGWHHGKIRGKETTVTCGFCGRIVPKYKTFSVRRGLKLSDPLIRRELGLRKPISLWTEKLYACPSCARFHRIVRKKR
jgi:ribosomal protein S26